MSDLDDLENLTGGSEFFPRKKRHHPLSQAARAAKAAYVRSHATHCKRGHEFTPENTKIVRHGTRECKACRRLSYQRSHSSQVAPSERE